MRGPWWREPLLHFLVFGLCVYGLTAALGSHTPAVDTQHITVTRLMIDDRSRQLKSALGRAPSETELRRSIERWIDEEVLVREAKRLGLDQQDPVIRARLAQKMGQLESDTIGVTEPSEAELRALYDAERASFQLESRLTMRQLFFEKGTDEARVDTTLSALRAGIKLEAIPEPGDEPPGGPVLRRRTPQKLAQQFGEGFAAELLTAPLNSWIRLTSTLGVHLIRIEDRTDGRRLTLEEAKGRLRQRALQRRLENATARALKRLRAGYTIDGWPQ